METTFSNMRKRFCPIRKHLSKHIRIFKRKNAVALSLAPAFSLTFFRSVSTEIYYFLKLKRRTMAESDRRVIYKLDP